MPPNPADSIRTSKSGRRAAAIRDSRHAKANAPTEPIALAQHTPGPWEVRQTATNSGGYPVPAKNYFRIVDRYHQMIAAYQHSSPEHHEQALANAALLAAAPEMAEALRGMLRAFAHVVEQWGQDDCREFNAARAALAKATGAQA